MPIDLSRSATSMTPAEVDEARAWREPGEPDATRGAPDPEATRAIEQAAAHGFRTPEWQQLSVRVGEGLIGLAVSSGRAMPARTSSPPRIGHSASSAW